MAAAGTAPAFLPGHFLPGCGTGAGRADELLVPRARQDSRGQTGDLAAQTQISDQAHLSEGRISAPWTSSRRIQWDRGPLAAVRSIQPIIWMQKNKEVLHYRRRNPALGPRFPYLR